jgi:hypothetical protein
VKSKVPDNGYYDIAVLLFVKGSFVVFALLPASQTRSRNDACLLTIAH